MSNSDAPESANKRIEIKNLSAEEKELTAEEAKEVKGGLNESVGIGAVVKGTSQNIAGHEITHIAGHEITHGLTEIKK